MLLFVIALFIASIVSYFIITNQEQSGLYLENLRLSAESGDANAMMRMGNNYKHGYNGLTPDNAEAVKWYQKAVEYGDTDAMNNLGLMYEKGEGVEKSYDKAFSLFEKACKADNGNACANIGLLFLDGEGVDTDYARAFEFFQKGVSLGNPESMAALGAIYQNGFGIEKDLKQAFSWYMKSFENGNTHPELLFQIGTYYDLGIADVKADKVKAKEWYEKSALSGHSGANRFLGYLYAEGIGGVQQDLLKAGECFSSSAQSGNKPAQKILDKAVKICSAYKNKELPPEVFKECLLGAYTNDPQAMHAVGIAYYKGLMGKKIDFKKAFEWFDKSAKLGHSGSQVFLGVFYEIGQGIPEDKVEAYVWYSLADTQKDLNQIQKKTASTIKGFLFEHFNANERKDAELRLKEYQNLYLHQKE